MKRLTREALETLAFAKRRLIEFDYEQGIAVVTVGRKVYYADLSAADCGDTPGVLPEVTC